MPTFYGAIDLIKNELRNAVIQNLGSAPASPAKGQIYMDTTTNVMYWWNGTQWVAAQAAAGAIPAASVTTQAVGDAPVVGTMTTYAREDHKHGREAFGVDTTLAWPGNTTGAGSSATIARSDHVHGTAPWASTFTAIPALTASGSVGTQGAANVVARQDHNHGSPPHGDPEHGAVHLNALAVNGSLNMVGQRIVGLGDPSGSTDAANKRYVDGLNWKQPVKMASTVNLALSGLVGVDSIIPASGDRILVKNQTTASQNGIYLASAGAWIRVDDMSAPTQFLMAAVWVYQGAVQGGSAWVQTVLINTVGTDSPAFSQFASIYGPLPTWWASTVTTETAFGQASAVGSSTLMARGDHTHGTPTHLDADHSQIHLNFLALPTGPVGLNNQNIGSLADPIQPQDAANKRYVDNAVAGLSWKPAVRLATTVNVGIGPSGIQIIDGVQGVNGDRILMKNQTTNPWQNGIWTMLNTGWTRVQDADSAAEMLGAAVFVEEGATQADTAWVCTNDAPITLNTTPLNFAQFAGGGTVTAGAGMTQVGNTLNVIAGDSTIVVNADELHVNPSVILPTAGTIAQALVKTSATNYAVGWDSVLGPPLQPGNVDFNTLTQTGVYNISTPNTNAPPTSAGGSGILIVTTPISAIGTYCSQIWQSNGTGGTSTGIWYRGQRASFWSPWVKLDAVVAGGALNQVLAKKSATDFDTQWITPAAGVAKFAAALGGTASPEVVTHNLNTRDIQLTVLNGSSPYTAVEVDWDATTVNTATIRYNPNLGATYRVVVTG